MPDIKEFIPFLIPLVIVQMVLLVYTFYHILTHKTYKRGSRGLWIAVYRPDSLFPAGEGGELIWRC